jgi:hypothetical protein
MLPLIQALISSGELAWPSEIQATPGDDLAQRAVAALEGIVLDEGRLQPPVQENGARAQRPGCNPSWFR